MGWDLPDGVTGHEFEIAGPDSETDGHEFCPTCNTTTDGVIITFHNEAWFVCDICSESMDLDD